ncbi:hypothetical protein EYF80_024301 [Liparis tanakae]|uniref:Uncharacterized protein n=1 Tax=Liparis tanakae TaxID=230148 RepID=A0A4Z2HKW7_9TELE|nr:hypothetical protein EYF80_024301 [Liparis tanakae]
MTRMCLSYLGALLLALHLISSQVVQAQNVTVSPTNTTIPANVTATTPPPENGCGTTAAFPLMLPLAAAASLFHIWS